MKRTPMFRVASTTLLFSLACAAHNGVAQDIATSSGPDDGTTAASASTSTSEVPDAPEPEPPPPADPGPGGIPCQVDADCDAGTFCALRICIAGCPDAVACAADEVCDPHGRCIDADAEEGPDRPLQGTPGLSDRLTVLAFGQTQARTILRNDGIEALAYRLAAANPALTLDTEPAALAPGEEVELVVDVEFAALAPTDRVLPVQIITSGGAILWSLEIDALPAAGNFRGAVSFDVGGVSLASSAITLDLDFRGDGTIVGRVDTDASLLWPQPLALTGTWNAAGDIALVLRDRLPAEDWRYSPLGRELGRALALTGKRTATGLEGTALETLTGLRAEPVQLQGAFALHRQGPLTGLVHTPDVTPKDAQPPTWLAPPGLDTEACDDLGDRYGTDLTLPEPSAACDACAAGYCGPDDMMDCGLALRAAAYNLAPVLAALHGKGDVKPPAGAWTWDDCAAEAPAYDEGLACLDIAALRCGHALIRRGSVQTPGPWGGRRSADPPRGPGQREQPARDRGRGRTFWQRDRHHARPRRGDRGGPRPDLPDQDGW